MEVNLRVVVGGRGLFGKSTWIALAEAAASLVVFLSPALFKADLGKGAKIFVKSKYNNL